MVTGAGRNIGRPIAMELALGGANVVILVRGNRQEAAFVTGLTLNINGGLHL